MTNIMKKHKYIFASALILLVGLMCCSVSDSDAKTVATSSTALSNKAVGWGIKRSENHTQPDLGSKNKRLIEQYNGIAMGSKDSKNVYLTFDLGYEAGYTSKILDTLKANNVTAAFFITAHYLNTSGDLVQRMIDEGHIVGNHTVNHRSLPELSTDKVKEEVQKLHTAVFEKTGYEMKYFRPPKGEYSQSVLDTIKRMGYTTVMWSLAYDDWDLTKQGREEYGKQKILDNIHPGAVILLHGTSKDNSNILDECIKTIKDMGYKFKSLDEFK
ncbi:MAG: polysaccharide deacetylase family protein [Clostridia bacterium]|nr:polysaccharide deacetylase family protein [Clostridia bacterium]